MRIGIVSDIHCNIDSLNVALDRMGNVDEVLCAGDAIFQFRFSNEVVARLREIGAHVVLGNHEDVVLGPQGDRVRDHPEVDHDLLKWLAGHPRRLDTTFDGKKFTVFHACPWEAWEYVYKENARIKEFADLGSDYVVYGHTHYALQHRIGKTLIINPGSAGQPRDPRNGFRSSYAILDTQSGEVTLDIYDDPVHKPHDIKPR